MALESDHTGLAESVGVLARARLDEAQAQRVDRLAHAFIAGLPPSEAQATDPTDFYGIILGLLTFLRVRRAGTAKVRVFTPSLDEHGWTAAGSVIEIVNDDMPFLVDSVTIELARQGIAVQRLIHPVLTVHRDAKGGLVDLLAASAGGGQHESIMHIETARLAPAIATGLEGRIQTVLADVRAAVRDWPPMRDRLKAVADTVAGLGGPDAAEAANFLNWLHEDHFVLLGYRQFDFGEGAAGVTAAENLGVLTVPGSRVFDDALPLASMPPEVITFLRQPDPLLITKSARHSTVHRPVHMDAIGVKRVDPDGRVVGLHAFLGLFTSAAYTHDPGGIPILRTKVAHVRRCAGFAPFGHDDKALVNILATFPRDELFQVSEDDLYRIALGILRLQERPRPALFVRRDAFDRFVSCLVFLPRDRYDTPLRLAVSHILEQAFDATVDAYYTQVTDAPLARLHVMLRTTPGSGVRVDEPLIERRIAEAARSWDDHLHDALVRTHGEAAGAALGERYCDAFPVGYRQEQAAAAAVADIDRIEAVLAGQPIALNLYRSVEASENQARLKLVHRGSPVPLSDFLPMLEAMGVRVIAEVPHEIRPAGADATAWIHDFQLESLGGAPIDLGARGDAFERTLARVCEGAAESDGFNRLVLAAGLDWREVVVLRAYAKYLHQIGIAFSQGYIERALTCNPAATQALVRLFLARFDPQGGQDEQAALEAATAALDGIALADDDRILRRYLNLIRATVRTSFFQTAAEATLAFKLDSRAIDEMPLPRPWVEIFVYSPRIEAIHLRGGRVARGGIRWSDRAEDFRTEILGLMKAQMVKNAVIVPTGAKGGFVVKRPPGGGDRDALVAEAVACYRMMMGAMLDLTDNQVGDAVVPPPNLIRYDGDDPYLVVAADKGTAKFSDIANAVACDRDFWLGDAFASGGSRGYDHKAMGITARGAWEAIKRHFRELGTDIQAETFTVVGIGDMSGDVFGNAMLLSPHIRLVAAFNHRHIMIDPDPDPASSFAERQRLFMAAHGWDDYDPAVLSPGGGIFLRTAKSIPVTSAMAARFGLEGRTIAPDILIRRVLTAPVDLLFFGGIGTFVRASYETDAEVGDRGNDGLRITAASVCARVIGEGANLAMTQRARIEAATRGIRLNTDAIDNSAGVDTSDHEVNIKILLNGIVRSGDLTFKQRDRLLREMTDEVAALVLRDNYLQTQALSVMESVGPEMLDSHVNAMRRLESEGRLDRTLEFLPDDATLTERAAARRGLVRPEMAILLSYAKLWLSDGILNSDLPDDPFLAGDLARYFPTVLRERFPEQIARHRLRREIIATTVANSMINRVGAGFVSDMLERSGASLDEIARAYIVARDAFRLRAVWSSIEALDGIVPAAVQVSMLVEANRLLERVTAWVLRCVRSPFDIRATITELAPAVLALEEALPRILPASLAEAVQARAAEYAAQGVPEATARSVANLIVLASAADLARIAARHALTVEEAGCLSFMVGERFALGWLRSSAQALAGRSHWEKLAAASAIEDLYASQRSITVAVASDCPGLSAKDALAVWINSNRAAVDRVDAMLAEMKAAPRVDLAMVIVMVRRLQGFFDPVTAG